MCLYIMRKKIKFEKFGTKIYEPFTVQSVRNSRMRVESFALKRAFTDEYLGVKY